MFFNRALVSTLLFASIALADRPQRRSTVRDLVGQSTRSASSQVQFTSTWAGASLKKSPDTFKYAEGTFTVPNISQTSKNGSAVAVWLGIDRGSCQRAALQTGIIWKDGENPSFQAGYEWYPAAPSYFSGISINEGDQIKLSVAVYSTTNGLVAINNLSNGQSAKQEVTSRTPLCLQDAEWIVQDLQDSHGKLLPLANFGHVTFTGVKAVGIDGTTYELDGANVYGIKQSSRILATAEIKGDSIIVERK